MSERTIGLLIIVFVLVFGVLFFVVPDDLFTSSEESTVSSIETTTEKKYQYATVVFDSASYDVVVVPAEQVNMISMYYTDESGVPYGGISALLERSDLEVVTNGGIFSTAHEPLGLYIEDSVTISEMNTDDGHGNFFLKPNGVFQLYDDRAEVIDSTEYAFESDVKYAIQSGPLLLQNGVIHPAFDENSAHAYIRNGVGVDEEGNVYLVISNDPVSLYDFAHFFSEHLQLKNALYLDGAISEMYVDGEREAGDQRFSVMIGVGQ